MSWLKNRFKQFQVAVLSLVFLLEGALLSFLFINRSEVVLSSLLSAMVVTTSAASIYAINMLTLVFLTIIAKAQKTWLEIFATKIGIINFSIIFLLIPLLFGVLSWSTITANVVDLVGVSSRLSLSDISIAYVIDVVIFFLAVNNVLGLNPDNKQDPQ